MGDEERIKERFEALMEEHAPVKFEARYSAGSSVNWHRLHTAREAEAANEALYQGRLEMWRAMSREILDLITSPDLWNFDWRMTQPRG